MKSFMKPAGGLEDAKSLEKLPFIQAIDIATEIADIFL